MRGSQAFILGLSKLLTCAICWTTHSYILSTCMICVSLHLTQKRWLICRRTGLFFHHTDLNTRLLAPGHSQLHAKGEVKENPSDTLMHGQAADEVAYLLISHWSAPCKMKGWSSVCWCVVTAVAEPWACRQTHWRMGLVIKEMAKHRTVIFYLY